MQLIHNWRQAYKLFSVQALAAIGIVQTVAAAVPASVLELHLPGRLNLFTVSDAVTGLTILATALGFIGRVVSQDIQPPDKTATEAPK